MNSGLARREDVGGQTLAQASRIRRDIVSGEVMAEEKLIRFVAGPDGKVVFDVARKLPGRGLWVAAGRASVDEAVRRKLFSRAAKAPLAASSDLADTVADLLCERLLAALGLARKGGLLILGFERVLAAVLAGKVACLIEAADGAGDGRRKLLAAAERGPRTPALIGLFAGRDLDLALGAENVIHTAFLAGRAADRWTTEVERLSGFRPLFPESWREEPRG